MNLDDFSYSAVDLAVWSILEPTLGIVNASLPVLRPVGSQFFKSSAYVWARTSFRTLLSTKSTRGGTSDITSGRSWPRSSKRSDRDSLRKLADPTDRLYPLDTINLVESVGDIRAETEIEQEDTTRDHEEPSDQ